MEQPSVHTLAILLLRSFSSHTHTSQADTEDLRHKLEDRRVVMSGMVEGGGVLDSSHKTWSPSLLPAGVVLCPDVPTSAPDSSHKTWSPSHLPAGVVLCPDAPTSAPDSSHKTWSPSHLPAGVVLYPDAPTFKTETLNILRATSPIS